MNYSALPSTLLANFAHQAWRLLFSASMSKRVVSRCDFRALPFLGRDGLDCGREQRMSYRINRPVFDPGARRVLAKEIVAFPILRRSDWPGNKTTAAVRADISQNEIDTARAKGAFVGADARFK